MTHTVEDLMAAAVGQRPMDFETAFHQLMLGKAHAAIEDRKIEYAKNMFAKAVKEDVEEVEEGAGENFSSKAKKRMGGLPKTGNAGDLKKSYGEKLLARNSKGSASSNYLDSVEKKKNQHEDVGIEERFGGKGSDPSLRNNPPKGASPAPAPKATGKSDLMTSLMAIKK